MSSAHVIPFPATQACTVPRSWSIADQGLATALSLAEEYALSLRVRLYNEAAGQDFETSDFTIRCAEPVIQILGPFWCVSVDLRRTRGVRAIQRGTQSGSRRLSLECLDARQRPLLSVSCPEANNTPEGRLWGEILHALAV